MKLVSLLDPDLILIGAKISSKTDAMNLMLQRLHKKYSFEMDLAGTARILAEREALGGTTFPSGISIPHARLENFKDLIIGVCVPEKPIESDGILIRMIVMILTEKSHSSLYLNTLASFIKLSTDEALFTSLANSADALGFMELVKKSDYTVKKELTVENIMATEVSTVRQETTIKELMDLFYKHQFSYAPVLDAQGLFIGEVNIRDTLRLGIPDYATMVGSLKFLSTFEPLEDLIKNEDTIPVSRIMKKPSVVFTPDTSIIEAVLEFSQNKRRHIAVVKDHKVLGVVSVMDILNKVMRS